MWHIMTCHTSCQMWQHLCTIYEQIFNSFLNFASSWMITLLITLINNVEVLVHQFNDLGELVFDQVMMTKILCVPCCKTTSICNQHGITFQQTIENLTRHKHGKVCQLETLVIFLENIHKVDLNILNLEYYLSQ
jgi:hypothetical protein